MIEGRQSETAIAAAVLRAAHQVLDVRPRILEDAISVGLVAGSSAAELEARRDLFDSEFMQTLRASFVLRSAISEAALGQGVDDGVRQAVFLGAGFDTFAFRQPSWASGLTIFEIDHPATQSMKQDCLREKGHSTPSNLIYCPADLEVDTIGEVLSGAGFDSSRPTFYSWLGVVPYLTEFAIESTLRELRGISPSNVIVLSYVLPDNLLDGTEAETVSISAQASSSRGEPWLSRHDRESIERLLRQTGYTTITDYGPSQYKILLEAPRDDGLPIPGFERVVVAR